MSIYNCSFQRKMSCSPRHGRGLKQRMGNYRLKPPPQVETHQWVLLYCGWHHRLARGISPCRISDDVKMTLTFFQGNVSERDQMLSKRLSFLSTINVRSHSPKKTDEYQSKIDFKDTSLMKWMICLLNIKSNENLCIILKRKVYIVIYSPRGTWESFGACVSYEKYNLQKSMDERFVKRVTKDSVYIPH